MATKKSAHGVRVRTLDQHEVISSRAELAALLTRAIAGTVRVQQPAIEREVSSSLALAAKSRGYVTAVAEDNGELCGTIIAEGEPGRRGAFVRWLAVRPTRRREGIGTLLADYLDDLVRPGLVRGMVDLDDTVASTFWCQRGWTSLIQPRRRIPMGMRLDA
jgi:GNAT superfamily N-acetyltransferase